jgi:hypothetical protein
MSTWVTVSDFRQYFDPAQAPPQTTEADALLQAVLDRSEAICARFLSGVVIEPPAPEDLTQVVLEVGFSIYLTRGSASLLETVGSEQAGGFQYVGMLNERQKAALRQVRLDLFGVAI